MIRIVLVVCVGFNVMAKNDDFYEVLNHMRETRELKDDNGGKKPEDGDDPVSPRRAQHFESVHNDPRGIS